MKKLLLLFLVLVSVAFAVWAYDTSSNTITFQGKLIDAAGNAVSGTREMEFYLFDHKTDGEENDALQYWTFKPGGSEPQANISVNDGIYVARLPLETDYIAKLRDKQALWIETVIENETLTPRIEITATMLAIYALHLHKDVLY